MHSMTWSILMLMAVLAAIPAVLWVLKRLQTLQPPGSLRDVELLAQLPLGPRERVVAVRLRQRVLLLGTTPQQITLLGEAAAHEWIQETGSPAATTRSTPPMGHAFALLMRNLSTATETSRARGNP